MYVLRLAGLCRVFGTVVASFNKVEAVVVSQPIGQERFTDGIRRHIDFAARAVEVAQHPCQRAFQRCQIPVVPQIGLIARVIRRHGRNAMAFCPAERGMTQKIGDCDVDDIGLEIC